MVIFKVGNYNFTKFSFNFVTFNNWNFPCGPLEVPVNEIPLYIYIYILRVPTCNCNNEFILRKNKMADFERQQLEIGLEFMR